jgi:chromosomal replication initiator protein
MAKDSWSEALERIRQKVNSQSFATWFKPTHLISKGAGKLTLGVPNPLFAEWLRNNYLGLIAETVLEVEGQAYEILFSSPQGQASASTRAAVPALPPRLDARYTFDSFVVGSGNQFARAAALAVAEQPSKGYNPLYVYGGTGLGKTHLMHAIGNQITRSGRLLRLKYLTTEKFVNELVNAIRFDKMNEFKDRYRNVDLLLIDDIQFLAGKERTQEEFFHTFNALYEGGRQIVLTSDCAPREIPTIEERLRSRFEWGLITDIQPPDLETKIAILDKKSAAMGVDLPSDAALYIASKIKSNVRELEGALNRVTAFSSVQQQPISLELAQRILKDIVTVEPTVITVESIQKVVADHYKIKVAQLKSKNNSMQIAFPRQIAMYLCKNLTDKSLPEIGRRFGGKHHSTVIHAIKKIVHKRLHEQDFDRLIRRFIETLQ